MADFRSPTRLADAAPVDCNYCVSDAPTAEERCVAVLAAPAAALAMEVWTDQPGLQVFTGQNIGTGEEHWWTGKGRKWEKCGAVCLEAQLWPDSANQDWPHSSVLKPGETYDGLKKRGKRGDNFSENIEK